jgi:hypothetical protein
MDNYILHALKIIGAPRLISIQNKKVAPAILFSPALGEPLVFWLASSISKKLHGKSLMHCDVVADHKRVSGAYLRFEERYSMTDSQGSFEMSLAASLLILSESADQILSPARSNPNYDYAPLIIEFRETILRNYNANTIVSPDDFQLNTVLEKRVFKAARTANVPTQRKL